jgi:opacity protein-like surface antigen
MHRRSRSNKHDDASRSFATLQTPSQAAAPARAEGDHVFVGGDKRCKSGGGRKAIGVRKLWEKEMLKWVGVAGAALVAAFATGTANAQMYGTLGYGWSRLDNATTRIENGVSPGVDAVFNLVSGEGYSGRGAIGWDLGAMRIEGEFGVTKHDNDRYDSRVPPNISRDLDGAIDVFTGMINAYYDFNVGPGFTPYIGAGAGVAQVNIEAIGPRPTAPNGAIVTMIKDEEIDAAWQIMGGVAIPVGGNLSVTAQYRYFSAGTVDVLDDQRRATHSDIKGDSWDLGVRMTF